MSISISIRDNDEIYLSNCIYIIYKDYYGFQKIETTDIGISRSFPVLHMTLRPRYCEEMTPVSILIIHINEIFVLVPCD